MDTYKMTQKTAEFQEILDNSASVLKAASLAVGCELEQIILATDTTTVLDDILYIYGASEQITYAKPSTVGDGEIIVSVDSGVLTTDASTYTLNGIKQEAIRTVADIPNLRPILGSKVNWMGYHVESDGGSNWGIVKSGLHTADGGSIFSIDENTYVEANLKYSKVSVNKFGALGDGSDESERLIAAIEFNRTHNGILYFPAPTGDAYCTSQTLIIYQLAKWEGCSYNSVTIKLCNNSDVNLVETYKFDTFNASGGHRVDIDPDFTYGFSIKNIQFDGNRANNYSGVVTNSDDGYGVRIYGRRYIIEDVYITECAGIGFYSVLRKDGTDQVVAEDDNAGHIKGLYINRCSYEGFVFQGPADIPIHDVIVGHIYPVGTGSEDATGASLLFAGESIDGIVFQSDDSESIDSSGTAEIGLVHGFGCRLGYCVRISGTNKTVRIHAENITAEGGIGNMKIDGTVVGIIGKISLRNNEYGSTPRPDLALETNSGLTVTAIEARRASNHSLAESVYIDSDQINIGTIQIIGGGYAGHGVVIEDSSGCTISQITTFALSGTALDGSPSSALWTKSGANNTVVTNLLSRNCDIGWKNESSARVIVESGVVETYGNTGIDFVATPSLQQLVNSSLVINDNGTIQFNSFSDSQNVTASVGVDQEFTFTHSMWRTPERYEVTPSIFSGSATQPLLDYLAVSSVSATEVKVKLRTSAGSGNFNLQVKI